MSEAPRPEPSDEVKAILREFVAIQKAKYGPDWKKKLSAEMAAKSRPFIDALLAAHRKDPR
ncbi:hypothetical protein HAP48_0042585 [Bradyrhizobium septentrionale]|uniref:Uncharacterized protein n=1 Tax=Bradyrhizobium septentrionale TaxID=1404411 RepID=A0A973W2L5_9BRAD|nr:hypothetical protein [Bradyrhizobium septentrionale]UGY15147.1 hypothetical protein HAP48_0042585 [Bradyrhizobium septentrionale]